MTMSLVGPYMTTTNYKKRKAKKLTPNKLEALRADWRKYNKDMRRKNMHSLQWEDFDDYVAYVQGNPPKRKNEKQEFTTYTPKEPMRRETPQIPSRGDGIGNGFKREANTYSGERQLLGVATMHKSNMVPVFADQKEQAKEIASMRR